MSQATQASLPHFLSLILTSIRRADGTNVTVNKNFVPSRADFEIVSIRAGDLFDKITVASGANHLAPVFANLTNKFSFTATELQLTKFTVYQDIVSSIDAGKLPQLTDQNEALNVISRMYTDIFNTMAVANAAREFLTGVPSNDAVVIIFKSVLINAFVSDHIGILADIEQVTTHRRRELLAYTLNNIDHVETTIAMLTVIKSDHGLTYDVKAIEQFLIKYNNDRSEYTPRDILRAV